MYQTVMYEVVRRQQNRLQFIHVFHNMQHMTICVTSYGALGHVPLDFQLLNFSGDFRAAQALKLDSMWLPSQKKSIHAYSFVTVYCVNFIFLCVTLIYFLLVLCPPRTKSWRLHCILPTTEKIIPRVKFAENKKNTNNMHLSMDKVHCKTSVLALYHTINHQFSVYIQYSS